jgi:hypothetical protein
MTEQEKTPNGAPIYRYSESQHKDFEPASGESHIEEISEHIEKYLGPIESVLHEIVSPLVHIDIHYVKHNDKFPFNIMVTSGLSDKAMNVPQGQDQNKYAELYILLPKEWPIQIENYELMNEIFKDENVYWPIRWLKTIARFPHEYNTWIGWGHTIPNGANASPFSANTKLGCFLLMPSISLPKGFFELKTKDGKNIKFYCLYPLYKEEMDYKLKNGTDKLLDKFEQFNISDIIDTGRPNTCIKKGLLGLW